MSTAKVDETERKTSSKGKNKRTLFTRIRDINRTLHSKGTFIILIFQESYFAATDLPSNLPVEIIDLLNKYADVFPEELPHGLPPSRGIEHQIDFVPGVVIPNRPTYRSTPTETKELQQ